MNAQICCQSIDDEAGCDSKTVIRFSISVDGGLEGITVILEFVPLVVSVTDTDEGLPSACAAIGMIVLICEACSGVNQPLATATASRIIAAILIIGNHSFGIA